MKPLLRSQSKNIIDFIRQSYILFGLRQKEDCSLKKSNNNLHINFK